MGRPTLPLLGALSETAALPIPNTLHTQYGTGPPLVLIIIQMGLFMLNSNFCADQNILFCKIWSAHPKNEQLAVSFLFAHSFCEIISLFGNKYNELGKTLVVFSCSCFFLRFESFFWRAAHLPNRISWRLLGSCPSFQGASGWSLLVPRGC